MRTVCVTSDPINTILKYLFSVAIPVALSHEKNPKKFDKVSSKLTFSHYPFLKLWQALHNDRQRLVREITPAHTTGSQLNSHTLPIINSPKSISVTNTWWSLPTSVDVLVSFPCLMSVDLCLPPACVTESFCSGFVCLSSRLDWCRVNSHCLWSIYSTAFPSYFVSFVSFIQFKSLLY